MTLYLLHITIFKIIVRLQVLKVMTEYISYNKYLFKKMIIKHLMQLIIIMVCQVRFEPI